MADTLIMFHWRYVELMVKSKRPKWAQNIIMICYKNHGIFTNKCLDSTKTFLILLKIFKPKKKNEKRVEKFSKIFCKHRFKAFLKWYFNSIVIRSNMLRERAKKKTLCFKNKITILKTYRQQKDNEQKKKK